MKSIFLNLLPIVYLIGIPLLIYYLLKKYFLVTIDKKIKRGQLIPISLLSISISWYLSILFRSAIGIIAFLLSISLQYVLFLNLFVGGIGLFLGFFSIKPKFFKINKVSRKVKIQLTFLGIVLIIYLFRSIAPVSHWDSAVKYITHSKYIAYDMNIWDWIKIFGNAPNSDFLIEILDAQLLFLNQNTLFTLILRWLNLVFLIMAIIGFLRILRVKYHLAISASTLVLLPFDFIILSVSGKLDSLIMCFEILSATFMILGVCFEKVFSKQIIRGRVFLLMLSVIFSIYAAGGRMSGIYLFFITSIVFCYYSWKDLSYRKFFTLFCSLLIITSILTSLYLFNFYWNQNPIYPVKAPNFFQGQKYLFSIDLYKSYYNLKSVHFLFAPFYMIIHLALGIEMFVYYFGWNFLPHAEHTCVSMEQLSPLLLVVFVVPFFLKKSRFLGVFFLLFSIWFSLWYSSIHYSRVFLAGGSLPIFMSVLIVSSPSQSLGIRLLFLRNALKMSFPILIVVYIIFLGVSTYNKKITPSLLYDKNVSHDYKIWWLKKHIPDQVDSFENFPDRSTTDKISEYFDKMKLTVVSTNESRAINILFTKGIFLETEQFDDSLPSFCVLINKRKSSSSISKSFSILLYENRYWLISCKSLED